VTSRRVDPLPVVAVALTVVAGVLYLWLVQQKGDGRFEPAWWFVGLVLLGAVEAAYGVFLPPPRQRVALVAAAVTLLAAAVLALQAMETSHDAALLGSVALPLLGAGGVCALRAWQPGRRLLVPVGAVAVLILVVALPSASYLATHGEGVGGDSSGG
jgi:hypothetical protein